MLLWIFMCSFSYYLPNSATAWLYSNCIFSLVRKCQTIFKMFVPFYIPINNVGIMQFICIIAALGFVTIFNFSHSDGCTVISHHGLYLDFLSGKWWWTCHVFIWQMYDLFSRIFPHCFHPFLFVCLLRFSFENYLYFPETNPSLNMLFANIFS